MVGRNTEDDDPAWREEQLAEGPSSAVDETCVLLYRTATFVFDIEVMMHCCELGSDAHVRNLGPHFTLSL